MKRVLSAVLVLIVAGPIAEVSAIMIDSVELELGRTEENRISAPLFATEGRGLSPLHLEGHGLPGHGALPGVPRAARAEGPRPPLPGLGAASA